MLFPAKKINIDPEIVSKLLYSHFSTLMSEFYEMQSAFLSTRYKLHRSLETSSIVISFIKSVHLAIIRQRERNLDHDLSLNSFFNNLSNLNSQSFSYKIVSVVNYEAGWSKPINPKNAKEESANLFADKSLKKYKKRPVTP